MKRKISLSTTITLVLLTMALTISLTMLLSMRHFNNQLQQVSQRQAEYEHIHNVDSIVRKYYPNLDEQLLRQGITQGFIGGIGDPYAVYYDPNRYAAETLRLSGKAEGLGFTLALDSEGRVTVSRVQPKSAAGEAGVKEGDLVTKLDGNAITNKTLAELHTMVNTAQKLVLTVQRGETAESFTLSAGKYDVKSVQSTTLNEGKIGYIRITGFYDNTPNQFQSALSSLKEKGVTGLIFDLRNNAGGTQGAVQQVLDAVMPLGTYGLMTDSKGNVTKLTTSVSNQVNMSTVTLINSGTAGEAEFFAGVLQEASLTTVVGQTSAGKAKYQAYFPLDADRSAVKLTVGEYGLLKGGSWQDKGIQPEVVAELPAEQAALSGLLKPGDDAQVKAAVDLIAKSDSNHLPEIPEEEIPPLTSEDTTTDAGGDSTTDSADSTTEAEGDTTEKGDDTTEKTEKTTKKED